MGFKLSGVGISDFAWWVMLDLFVFDRLGVFCVLCFFGLSSCKKEVYCLFCIAFCEIYCHKIYKP